LVVRREFVAFIAAVVLCVILVANVIVANSLDVVSCQTDPLSCLK
jgi:hypothetical protein